LTASYNIKNGENKAPLEQIQNTTIKLMSKTYQINHKLKDSQEDLQQ
jgi:hypothetical protein